MGRELKRVPLNFNAPLRELWRGYINPYSDKRFWRNCPFCEGKGESPECKRLSDQWYGYADFQPEDTGSSPYTPQSPPVRAFAIKNTIMGAEGIDQFWNLQREGRVEEWVANHPDHEWDIEREGARLCGIFNSSWSHHLDADDVKALLDDERLVDFTRYPLNEEQKAEYEAVEAWNNEERARAAAANWKGKRNWKTFNNGHIPTPQEVNDWSIVSHGHDSINSWVCIKAKLKRLGIRSSRCAHCKGDSTLYLTPRHKKLHDNWKPKEPPKGKGFQLWETTSEGSPVSPVFATFDALCGWCALNASTFGSHTATKEEWAKMLDDGLVYHQHGNVILI